MRLRPIEILSGIRAALEADPGEGDAVWEARVVEPLRPLLQPFSSWGPLAGAPLPEVAAKMSVYGPANDRERGLESLDRLRDAGSWEACCRAVRQSWEALDADSRGVELEGIDFTLVLSSDRMERGGGYTGMGGMPGKVWVAVWPDDENLPKLPAATAHEVNHNVRFLVEPFHPMHVTVGQYVVAEGLAESFAAELYGEERTGPWATPLDAEERRELLPRFREALDESGFDTARAWIFGDWAAEEHGYEPLGLPDFAGYRVGYELVRAFAERTDSTVAEATYLPWKQIVEGSGYF